MSDHVLVIPRKKGRTRNITKLLKTPYGLEVVGNSMVCPPPKDWPLSRLPYALQAKLNAISVPATYSKGQILFAEGYAPRGVYLISKGRVKLSASAPDGKSLIIRMADVGEIVGLPAAISGKRHEVTAESLAAVEVRFIRRKRFRDFVRAHGEVGLSIAEMLSEIYHATYREVRYLGLSGSAEGKLARFLLNPVADQNHDHTRASSKQTLTHEEIAGLVGTSRETVTRLFADFKRKRLIEVDGSGVLVTNRAALQELLA